MSSIVKTYGGDVMLQLGEFQFGISTAAYQELSRDTEYRWAEIARFRQDDALQFTGPGADTMNLSGTVYPEYRGGLAQLITMRALAAKGQPQLLVDGMGMIHGVWVIKSISERQNVFGAGGQPRRQEFRMLLRRAPDDALAAASLEVFAAAAASANATSSVYATSDEAANALVLEAAKADAAAMNTNTKLTESGEKIKAQAGSMGGLSAGALGAVSRSSEAATGLRSALGDARSMLASAKSFADVAKIATNLYGTASSLAAMPASAALTLRRTAQQLQGINSPQAAVSAVRAAAAGSSQLTALASNTASTAASMLKRIPL